MKIDMRAPNRKSDIGDRVKKLTLTADDGRDDEMEFLSHLNKVWLDGGIVVVYAHEDLIGKHISDVASKVEPVSTWSSGLAGAGIEET